MKLSGSEKLMEACPEIGTDQTVDLKLAELS